jgi:hypothetical protein
MKRKRNNNSKNIFPHSKQFDVRNAGVFLTLKRAAFSQLPKQLPNSDSMLRETQTK